MKTVYLVTGAAGHLGGAVVRRLRAAGQPVRALRLPGEAPPVQGARIRWFTGDVRDPASLAPFFAPEAGARFTVIHTAGIVDITGRMTPALRQVNVQGTRNLLGLARAAGARFVHVSSVHAIPERPEGQTIREIARFFPARVRGGYAKTKAEASQAVLEAAAAGLDAVVVHPSGILGPFDTGSNHLVQLVRSYLTGRLPVCVAGGYDFVDVRDVAEGCLLAAEKGRAGRCYILSGQYASVRALLAMAGRLAGRRPPSCVGEGVARALVPLAGAAARVNGGRPLFTGYSLHTLAANGSFSHERAGRELGYRPRPLEVTVQDTVAWLRAAGAVPPRPAAAL